ncbi:MAG: hypothetical protein K2G31_03680, partial [Clostridia bacterium]|nr:hypothetical protein [Clostridia bacterium]
MRKKFYILFITAIMLICSAIALTACDTTTEQGKDEITNGGSSEEAHIHSIEHHSSNAATCTTDGNVEYWHCSICDKSFSDEGC